MTIAEQVIQKLQALPEQQQRAVLQFIERLPISEIPQSRLPLYGLLKGYDISDAEIVEARREMWGNFPREDF